MQVAIKHLKRGVPIRSRASAFRVERPIWLGSRAPQIASLLDGGATETGLPYFVMENVDRHGGCWNNAGRFRCARSGVVERGCAREVQ